MSMCLLLIRCTLNNVYDNCKRKKNRIKSKFKLENFMVNNSIYQKWPIKWIEFFAFSVKKNDWIWNAHNTIDEEINRIQCFALFISRFFRLFFMILVFLSKY